MRSTRSMFVARFGLKPEYLIGAVTLISLFALWEALSRVGYLSSYHFPRPTKLAETLQVLVLVGFPRGVTVWHHISATVWRIVRGYSLAAAIAIPLGLVIGGNQLLDRAISPIVTFGRSIAIISLLPLFVAWFGVGEATRVLLIAYGCFWVILTNAIGGVKQVDIRLIQAGRLLGCNRQQLFARVILPAAIPRVFAGLKIALGVAFAVIVAVEMIGTIEGLGALIMESRTFYRSDAAIVGMFFIAMFGLGIATGLDRLEHLLLPWAKSLEAESR